MADSANKGRRVFTDFIVPTRPQYTLGLKQWCWADSVSILLLLILAAQLLLSSARNSATYDEQYHIANGLNFLRTGDPDLLPAHPPFIEALATLPLAADQSLVLPSRELGPAAVSSLTFSDQLLWRLNQNGPAIVARARLPIVGLTLLLAFTVYAWSRELFGPVAGLLALTMMSFDPNILAHGNLATNDMGVTCFATLTLYTFWRWMSRPTPVRAVIAGLFLGLAQVSKFSAVYLVPVVLIILATDRIWKSTSASRLPAKTTVAYLTVIAVAGFCAIWLGYGFNVGTLKGYPFPAREYLNGLQAATNLITGGRNTFLLGAHSPNGWWYYFPVAFAVKTPLPTLMLIAASFVFVWRRGTWRSTSFLLIPVIIYFAICLASPFDIGYRHLLPILPCLFIFTSQLALFKWKPSRTAVLSAMVLWLIIASAKIFPHYLTFFNEVAGGPENGYKILIDSNLDWGQELIGLRKYMTQENISSVKLSYHGTADPTAYGVVYEPLPSYPYNQWTSDTVPDILLNPSAGVYAISANNLQGLRFKNPDLYATFRRRKPDAIVGHSIFIYRINRVNEQNPTR